MRLLTRVCSCCLRGLLKLLGYVLAGSSIDHDLPMGAQLLGCGPTSSTACARLRSMAGRSICTRLASWTWCMPSTANLTISITNQSAPAGAWSFRFSPNVVESLSIRGHLAQVSSGDPFETWMEDLDSPTGDPVQHTTRPAKEYPKPWNWSPNPHRFLGFAGSLWADTIYPGRRYRIPLLGRSAPHSHRFDPLAAFRPSHMGEAQGWIESLSQLRIRPPGQPAPLPPNAAGLLHRPNRTSRLQPPFGHAGAGAADLSRAGCGHPAWTSGYTGSGTTTRRRSTHVIAGTTPGAGQEPFGLDRQADHPGRSR